MFSSTLSQLHLATALRDSLHSPLILARRSLRASCATATRLSGALLASALYQIALLIFSRGEPRSLRHAFILDDENPSNWLDDL